MIRVNLNISAPSVASDPFSSVNNFTLRNSTGLLNLSTGLTSTKGIDTSTGTIIIKAADYAGDYAWLFVKNNDTVISNYITVRYGSQNIGRVLGRGECAFIPYDGTSDIRLIAQSVNSIVEFALFNEG
jgi:hypothetical protein